jgi:hypothetical protein
MCGSLSSSSSSSAQRATAEPSSSFPFFQSNEQNSQNGTLFELAFCLSILSRSLQLLFKPFYTLGFST